MRSSVVVVVVPMSTRVDGHGFKCGTLVVAVLVPPIAVG
jgi:hypothetical protein